MSDQTSNTVDVECKTDASYDEPGTWPPCTDKLQCTDAVNYPAGASGTYNGVLSYYARADFSYDSFTYVKYSV